MEELEFETVLPSSIFPSKPLKTTKKRFHCRFEYNTDLFEKQTILRKVDHFRNLVDAVLKNPDERVSQIPLMDKPGTRANHNAMERHGRHLSPGSRHSYGLRTPGGSRT